MVDRHRPEDGPSESDIDTSGEAAGKPDQTSASMGSTRDKEDVKQRAGEAAERTKQRAKEGAEEIKARGKETARELRHTAEEEVDRRSTQTAERMESVVRALHTAADELEQDGRRSFADYARRAADQVERLTGYLRDEDAPSMLRDIEGMAKNNPGTFLGTSFAAGLAVGRFLRSSESSGRTDGHEFEGARPDYAMAGTYPASAEFPSGAESQDFPSGTQVTGGPPDTGTSSSFDEGRL